MRMGDHLGNQKQIREAMVVRPGQSGQYYGAVVAGLLQVVSKPGLDRWCQRGRWTLREVDCDIPHLLGRRTKPSL